MSRNLTLPSGDNLTIAPGKNLVLPPTTVIARWRIARTPYPVWMLSARVSRSSPVALSPVLLSGEILLAQQLRVRSNRVFNFVQNASARGKRVGILTAQLRAVVARETMFGQNLHAFARSGYRLFALNLATGEEASLGFLPADGPLTLDDVALADGDYEIRVRADGCYWRDARYTTAYSLSIEGGEIVAPLPSITGLKYSRGTESLMISWTWLTASGTQTPQDFAIWTDTSLPVDTSSEPMQTVAALAPGGYSTTIPDEVEAFYVAVCARRDDRKGPVSTLAIPTPESAITSPQNQTAWFEKDA